MSRKLRSGFWLVCQQQVFGCLDSAISIIQIKFFVWLWYQIPRDRNDGSRALRRPCQTCMIFIFSPRSFYCYSLWEKRRADCNIALKSKDQTMARNAHSWLCDVYVKVYRLFPFFRMFSEKWLIDQHLTYLLAFDGGVNLHFMSVLSGKCGYTMFWIVSTTIAN